MKRHLSQIAAGLTVGALVGLGLALSLGRLLARTEDRSEAGRAVPESASGALAEVWLHWTSDSETMVAEAYADFLGALPASVAVAVAVGSEEEARSFRTFLVRQGLATRRPARTVVTAGPITTWSRDRALALAAGESLTLLVAPQPEPTWRRRWNDWRAVHALAAARGRSRVLELPLAFDGGDLLLAGERVIFDANLLEKNRDRGYETVEQLRSRVAAWTGRPAVALGAEEGDVPRYHLTMYTSPAGPGTMLVGDPHLARARLGDRWRPGQQAVETGEALVPDWGPVAQARFDRAARELGAQGYRVVRIPVIPFDDRTYITWTNAVLDGGASPRVYLPVYADATAGGAALAELDASAAGLWREQGFAVSPVRVAGLWRHHGTIGCLVNVVRRTD